MSCAGCGGGRARGSPVPGLVLVHVSGPGAHAVRGGDRRSLPVPPLHPGGESPAGILQRYWSGAAVTMVTVARTPESPVWDAVFRFPKFCLGPCLHRCVPCWTGMVIATSRTSLVF